MVLGLKHGVTELVDHDLEWGINAAETIQRLWAILGSTAKDIQHIGSTAIRNIKAKPVIDIAVLACNYEEILSLTAELEKEGFIFRGWEGNDERQPVFQCGEYIQEDKEMRVLTHFIHIVKADSQQWHDYINLRNYMNAYPTVAHEYERVKLQLADENRNDYHKYHLGKKDYIIDMIKTANQWSESNLA